MTAKRVWPAAACVLAIFLAVYGCGSSSSTTAPAKPSTSHTFTSSTVAGHTHTVKIDTVDVSVPPVSGISKQTSSSSGHTHTFTISQAQLTNVKGGGTEVITTSVTNGHSHTFTITKWF
jgi:hypothetical protein